MIKHIINILYPKKCTACSEILKNIDNFFCDECITLLNFSPLCECFVKYNECRNCKNNIFEKNISSFAYTGLSQDLIYKLKYGKRANIAKGMSFAMLKSIGGDIFRNSDYIVPIPVHRNRLKSRGFNQAYLIALGITKILKIQKPTNLIFRIKDTKPLASLSPSSRINMLEDAFYISKKYDIQGKTILLVDDIFTTGSTLNTCANILYKNGAKSVMAATFAIVKPK
ncbi:MAG: ComF family protein [Defluviitaleaceae bacterium]|nr:ComF family protein [Defluviitaleaceae bacterium]